MFDEMEKMGVCRRSSSPWVSLLHVVRKADGGWRPSIWQLQRPEPRDKGRPLPPPAPRRLRRHPQGGADFSVIDMVCGFHQIPMAKVDVQKTAIITPFGLYEFTRMSFGLKNTAQAFQELMYKVLAGLPFIFIYLAHCFGCPKLGLRSFARSVSSGEAHFSTSVMKCRRGRAPA